MSDRAILIGSLSESPDRVPIDEVSELVDILEVRADLVGEVDVAAIRRRFAGRLLFTLRSRREGGKGPDGGRERQDRLSAAAAAFDLVDLEVERDLHPDLLDRIEPGKRIISWHGPRAELDDLEERLAEMTEQPARWYKLVSFAERAADCLAPLVLARKAGRDDLIAFAAGEIASWTRLLAPRLGAPVVFGAVGSREAAPGQPSIERLRRDYLLPQLPPVRHLFGLVGHPIAHSLSPRLHNAMYHALGLEHLYVAFDMPVFGDFWLDIIEGGPLQDFGFPITGLSVTAPFKEIALAVAGAPSPLAERIGSANTLIRRSEVWEAETTDPDGIRGPLAAAGIGVAGRRAAIIGAGGAGRAAVFGLGLEGAAITLVNRGRERGRRVAGELGVDFLPFDELDPGDFDIIVNATPLGASAGAALPFDAAALGDGGVVIDMAYRLDRPTALVEEARRHGRLAIDGRETLLYQAVPQFRAMNEVAMPVDLARRILDLDGTGSN